MTRVLVSTVALLTLSPAAQGAATPIRSLLTGSGGQLTLSPNTFLVSKRTSAGGDLTLGVAYFTNQMPDRINTLAVLALREYLTPAEQDLFSRNVVRVALRCFNLLPQRQAAITAWLRRQNESALRNVASTFGPMTLRFSRDIDEDGHYSTSVTMRRTGAPGVGPWVNYCTP